MEGELDIVQLRSAMRNPEERENDGAQDFKNARRMTKTNFRLWSRL